MTKRQAYVRMKESINRFDAALDRKYDAMMIRERDEQAPSDIVDFVNTLESKLIDGLGFGD